MSQRVTEYSLRKKCPYSKLFWSVFTRIRNFIIIINLFYVDETVKKFYKKIIYMVVAIPGSDMLIKVNYLT